MEKSVHPSTVDQAEFGGGLRQVRAGQFDLSVALGLQSADRALKITLNKPGVGADRLQRARDAPFRLVSVGAPPPVSTPFTSAAQFAINGQYGIEFLLQIIAAFLAFLQIKFKVPFIFKALTLSLRQLVFQFIDPLDIALRTRYCR